MDFLCNNSLWMEIEGEEYLIAWNDLYSALETKSWANKSLRVNETH